MKMRTILVLAAATMFVGCSKCSQQPATEAPVVTEPAVVEGTSVAPVEGGSAEALPNSEQMNEELPPAEGDSAQ